MPARTDATWHTVSFADRAEAAAFVAALSRVLASPAGAGRRGSREPPEVWVAPSGGSIAVLLSGGAFEAANAAFAPLPAQGTAALPPGSRLLVDAGTPPLGIEQARRRLARGEP